MTLTKNRLVKYLLEAKEELQKVTWPTRKDVQRYTLLVIAMTIGLAAYFGVIDFGMQLGLEKLLEVSTAPASAPVTEFDPEITIDPNTIEVETTPVLEGTETTIVE